MPRDGTKENNAIIFETIYKNFKILWGETDPKYERPFGDDNGVPILTETHLMKNMHLLTGDNSKENKDATEYFGKILYLYLANGLDHAKITMKRFYEGLAPFAYEDNKQAQQKLAFSILDMDRDGCLNIINLLHLYKHFKFYSRIG